MNTLTERFLRYIRIDSRSCPDAGRTPSSPGQGHLARLLAEELCDLGLSVSLDEHAYVVASLPARNADPCAPSIGLLAHLDTACEAPGKARPRVIENYDGGPILLGHGLKLDPEEFPSLAEQCGKTLFVTDGSSLLGADDKSGIAVIMSVLNEIKARPEIAHGPIKVAFLPDEEIGHGAALLDLQAFGADFAYTLDGSGVGAIECENFNAAEAVIRFHGKAIHPGHAKNHMINALLLAQEFLNGLPKEERPEHTDDRQGFYHVTALSGEVGEATLHLLIRDHDRRRFEERAHFVRTLADSLNARYPADPPRLTLTLNEQYRNMLEKIEPHRHIVDTAFEAIRACGLEPRLRAIRGGTDGARLSWRGLPTPNLFAGAYNSHGPFEYVALEDMVSSARVVLHILQAYANPDRSFAQALRG